MNEMSDGCVGECGNYAAALSTELSGGEFEAGCPASEHAEARSKSRTSMQSVEGGPVIPPASDLRSSARSDSQLHSETTQASERETRTDAAQRPLVFLSADISSPLDRPLLLAVGMISLAGREFYAERKERRLVPDSPTTEYGSAPLGNVSALRFLRADDVKDDRIAVDAGNWLSSLGAEIVEVACLRVTSLHLVDRGRATESSASTQLRFTLMKPLCRAGADFIGDYDEIHRTNEDHSPADLMPFDIRTIHGWKTAVPRYDAHLQMWLGPDHPLQRAKTLRMLCVVTGRRNLLRALKLSLNLAAEGVSRFEAAWDPTS